MPFRHKAYRVLQVEDNADNAKAVEMLLAAQKSYSYEVHSVTTLEDALETMRHQPPDVVLLDVGLPDASGLEGFGKIHREFPDVPVVLLTGREPDEMLTQAMKMGAQDFLQKGHTPADLLCRSLYGAIKRNELRVRLVRLLEEAREKIRELEQHLTASWVDLIPAPSRYALDEMKAAVASFKDFVAKEQ